MVSSVGGISIDLSANTSKFIAGFKKSADTVDRESKRMSNSVNGFAKASAGMFKSFAGGVIGGAVAQLGLSSLSTALDKARQSLSDFEEIGNRAKATGLGTDTFQAISHGAALADVEQESLNKSLEIFAKNAGLAKEGTGALYSGLLKLNPQLLQSVLHATSQEERLKLVADAMADMTDATDKAALATAVFGRGGAEMVRVLDKGSESIEKMKQDAKDLGIIIPEDLIARSGELDDKLTTLSTVIGVNMKEALAKAGPLLVALANGMVIAAQRTNEFATAVEKFANDPSWKNLGDLLGAKIRPGSVADKLFGDSPPRAIEEIQGDLVEVHDALKGIADLGLEGPDSDHLINALLDDAIKLNAELERAINLQIILATQERRTQMAQMFRASENASMEALSRMPARNAGGLPTVHHGVETVNAKLDPEVMDDVEDAIEKETEATNRVAARATDVYRGVQQFDAHSAGYFDRLGSQIESGLQSVGRALSYRVPAGGGYATGAAANSFAFSGKNNTGTSWAGRQMTFGGNSEADTAYYNSVFGGRKYRVGGAEDASSITSGATGTTSGAINMNIVVKPVMEGTRLSGQSAAEIKQAASAGANAALRAYYGR